jgi:hypothetical protein
MQCAYAILSSVACFAVRCFPTLSHNRNDFRKKFSEHKMRVSIFSATFVWNILHSKKNWERCKSKLLIGLHVNFPLFLSYSNESWSLSTDFRKMLKYKISWQSVQWDQSSSKRTDGRTGGQTDGQADRRTDGQADRLCVRNALLM